GIPGPRDAPGRRRHRARGADRMTVTYLRSLADDAPGGLASLRVRAPASVADGALVEVGLADRMAPMDSPLGTLWVAWNGRGVSEGGLAAGGGDGAARHAPRAGPAALVG